MNENYNKIKSFLTDQPRTRSDFWFVYETKTLVSLSELSHGVSASYVELQVPLGRPSLSASCSSSARVAQ